MSIKRITHENKAKAAKLAEWDALSDDNRVEVIRLATWHRSTPGWASFFKGLRFHLMGAGNPNRPKLPTPTSAARGHFRAGQEVAKSINSDISPPDWYHYLGSLVDGTPAPVWGDCHRSD